VALLVTFGSAAGITVIIADPSVRSDLILPWRWALASLGLWSLLGLVTILARLAQWRVRRQKRSEAVGVTARE
jgi:cyanate permease